MEKEEEDDVRSDEIEEEENDVEEDDVEKEEDDAFAVEMHIHLDMSKEAIYAEIQRKNATLQDRDTS